MLFRGVSVAPYFTQLLVALASGTSISDVSRSLQRADCLACSFFSDLLTGLSQTWCGCSAVYGERVVIKTSIKLNQSVSHPARDACARWFSASCKQSCLLSTPAILIIINGATELELLGLSVHHTSRSSMSTVVSHSIKLTWLQDTALFSTHCDIPGRCIVVRIHSLFQNFMLYCYNCSYADHSCCFC